MGRFVEEIVGKIPNRFAALFERLAALAGKVEEVEQKELTLPCFHEVLSRRDHIGGRFRGACGGRNC
eukprot:5762448-Amphidinium_carterae.1